MSGPLDLDLAPFDRLTPEEVAERCQSAMDACDAAIAEIIAVEPGTRTFENTLVALESAVDHVLQAGGTYAFMAYVSVDDRLRETAREWEERIDRYQVGLGFRDDLYAAVSEFAATPEAASLQGEARRLLEHTLRDYRRRGFALPPEQRARVQELFDRLVALGTTFQKNIDTWQDAIVVPREDLDGLPDAFIEGLTPVEQPDGSIHYRVSLDYPEFYPFLSNARSSERRRELFIKNYRKGGRENVAVLEEAIGVRTEIAGLLGYDSWAAYVLEVRMAKERSRVADFLEDLEARVRPKRNADLEELTARSGRTVEAWDWRFHVNELLKTEYNVDEFAVAQYFPLDACLEGLFSITQDLLGLRYVEATGAPRWHPEVQAYDVYETDGDEPLARFYMDLFPRPNTYGHAAAFTLRKGRLLPDGSYQRPVSAIVANFTRPTATTPSLLRHSEVVTLFHEFGHILHQTLTRASFLEFSGTSTERDFVEAPSQMMEHWCWNPESLGFARHHATGEPLPPELLASMVRAKNVGSGIATARQLYFASLDLAYHSPGFDGDTTGKAAELHPVTGFPCLDDTYFQAGFGHLFGYDAGYYGYLWSQVFGDDMFTRFEQAGILDRATGMDYRRTILERGGSLDGARLVHSFLGREPTMDAFLREIGVAR